MLFVVFMYFINVSNLIRTPIKSFIKIRILTEYTLYSLLLTLPIRKPTTIIFVGFKISGFDFQTLHYLIGEIFVKNEYFFSTSKSKPIIFDCGSNIGVSLLYFKFLFPNSRVTCFEPDPRTFKLLKKNVKINKLKNVTLYNHALSDRNHVINFYISNAPGSLIMSSYKERMAEVSVKVKAIKLSEIIKNDHIDFIKMDIEGSEVKVLNDLVNKNKLSQIDELVIEYHHNISDTNVLSSFLTLLEHQYKYQLSSLQIPLNTKNMFQDVLIYAYKKQ